MDAECRPIVPSGHSGPCKRVIHKGRHFTPTTSTLPEFPEIGRGLGRAHGSFTDNTLIHRRFPHLYL